MKGIVIYCEVLYFATFRKPSSTSLILTYPIPPFTTIRGMIANAMGLKQHDHSLQEQIKLGIRVIHPGYKNEEMAKVLKLKESTMPLSRSYPSAPMFREYLVNPIYEFFIGGNDDIINEIHLSLENPKRPLYLGQSDDLIDIKISEIIDLYETVSDNFDSIVGGIHSGCKIEKLPYTFEEDNGKYSLSYKFVSLSYTNISVLKNSIGYKFNKSIIELF
jgi:CRISPR-associated protein Cas5h